MIRLLLLVSLVASQAHAILCITTTSTSTIPVCPSTNTTTSVTTTTCPVCGSTTSTSTSVPTTSTSTTTLPPSQGDFFIDNSCANNGDGKANSCAASPGASGAWNTLNHLNCAAISGPDSTLTIRSHGGTARSQRYVGRWSTLEIGSACSGSAGHPFIIQNASGEDVVMDGTADIHGNTWTDRGGGIWECTSGTNCGPPTGGDVFLAGWYTKGSIAGGVEQFVKLVSQRVTTCAGSGLTANQMANLSGAAGNLCVRLADDSSPTTTDYFDVPVQTLWLAAYNAPTSYVTMRVNPGGGSWTIHRFRNHIGSWDTAANIGWTLDGLNVGYVYDRCFQMTPVSGGGQPDWVVKNNTISFCGQEGIRPDAITGGSTLLENNDISGIQSASVFVNCGNGCRKSYDNGTPIRLAADQGITVRGNTVHDFGGGGPGRSRGIDLEGGGVGHLIENNYVYNQVGIEDGGDNQQGTGALNFSAATFSSNDWSANVVRNNRFENVQICFRFQTNFDTGVMTPSVFENNTCFNPKFAAVEVYGAGLASSSPPFQWTNNIFANYGPNTVRALIHAPTPRGTAWDATAFTFNDYYCSACTTSTQIITINGTTAVATNVSVQAMDPDSTYALPALDVVGSPPTLKIINTGGAYGLGTPITPAFPDFEGTTRPQSQGWDLGADEFTGTTATTSSTTTSTGIATTTSTGATTTTVSTTSTVTTTSSSTTTVPTPVQVLVTGGYGTAPTATASATGIAGAGYTSGWDTPERRVAQVIPTSGIIGGLRALTDVAPGGTASWVVTLYKNEVATGLTCTITSGATSCSDTTTAHNVTFGILDRAAVRATPANTPASGKLQVSTLWQPTTADETIWPGALGGTLAAGTAGFLPLNTRSASTTSFRGSVVPIPGTVKHLAAWTYSNMVAGSSRTFTIQKNGTDTALTCTVPDGAATCTDADDGHAVSVVAGDSIRTAVTFSGTPIDQPLSDGVVFVPTTSTQFVAGMGYIQTPPTTATDVYNPMNSLILGTQLTTENLLAQQIGQAMTLKNMQVKLAGNTGSGSTLAVTLRKNGSSSALTCSMTNGSTCNLTTDVTVADNDLLGTLWHHTGSAGTSQEAAVSYSAIFTGTFP